MPRGIYERKRRPVELRFQELVAEGPLPEFAPHLGPCLLWQGTINPDGYGEMGIGDKSIRAHRIAIELADGTIPAFAHVDHLCRVRACVRRSHLDLVTNRENTLRGFSFSAQQARQTHCKRGHEFTPENTRIFRTKHGQGRRCIACVRAADRVRWAKRKAA